MLRLSGAVTVCFQNPSRDAPIRRISFNFFGPSFRSCRLFTICCKVSVVELSAFSLLTFQLYASTLLLTTRHELAEPFSTFFSILVLLVVLILPPATSSPRHSLSHLFLPPPHCSAPGLMSCFLHQLRTFALAAESPYPTTVQVNFPPPQDERPRSIFWHLPATWVT